MKKIKVSKYDLYEASVIDPTEDIRVFSSIFKRCVGRDALLYREDFCGTFAHSAEWIKQSDSHRAWALDLDSRPLDYGMKRHFQLLSENQKRRLKVLRQNVLKGCGHKVDLVTATNFSYFFFKSRVDLLRYFLTVFKSLKKNGVFLLDSVGGTQMQSKSCDVKKIPQTSETPTFKYFWEQKDFNIINHEARFAIHFEIPGMKKIRNAFVYDWRIWTIAELRDLLVEAGFDRIEFYFEGTTRSGDGDGIFRKKSHEEICDVWIAYIAAVRA